MYKIYILITFGSREGLFKNLIFDFNFIEWVDVGGMFFVNILFFDYLYVCMKV